VPSSLCCSIASESRANGKRFRVFYALLVLFNRVRRSYSRCGMDRVADRKPWYCALHGTVSQCPFSWMGCDVDWSDDSAALSDSGDSQWLLDLDGELPAISDT